MERNFQEEQNAFFLKTENALRKLFDAAKGKNELHFALSLSPEFRGEQDAGWCTAEESFRAFDEYVSFLKLVGQSAFSVRVSLGFYCHIAEASGFYEIPKNMLRICDGEKYNLWPFQKLVAKHAETGAAIAPNANKVLKDLVGHSNLSGFLTLSEVFRDAFDPDLRNGYSHSDYVIWTDGIRLRKRNGGQPRKISWPEFDCLFHKGVNFFNILRHLVVEYQGHYNPPKIVRGQFDTEPAMDWRIYCNPQKHSFSISNGK